MNGEKKIRIEPGEVFKYRVLHRGKFLRETTVSYETMLSVHHSIFPMDLIRRWTSLSENNCKGGFRYEFIGIFKA